MRKPFPLFIAKDRALNLERRFRDRINGTRRWGSWANACAANCKRVLNPLRYLHEDNRRDGWLIACRVATNRISSVTYEANNPWKPALDKALRMPVRPEIIRPGPPWEATAMREASRMAKSKFQGVRNGCLSWSKALVRARGGLTQPIEAASRDDWRLSAIANTRNRFGFAPGYSSARWFACVKYALLLSRT
ncbi:MAG: hypothetical protein K8S54_10575 [Spirochaetia bacterium]|nr:hypothetical protein [Spirochaetia bacterium]